MAYMTVFAYPGVTLYSYQMLKSDHWLVKAQMQKGTSAPVQECQ